MVDAAEVLSDHVLRSHNLQDLREHSCTVVFERENFKSFSSNSKEYHRITHSYTHEYRCKIVCKSVHSNVTLEHRYVPERQGTIRVYDIHRGDVIKSLHGHMGAVNSCVYVSTLQCTHTQRHMTPHTHTHRYRPSHQELYSGGHDGLIVKWASKSRGGLSGGGDDDDDDSDLGDEDNWSSSE